MRRLPRKSKEEWRSRAVRVAGGLALLVAVAAALVIGGALDGDGTAAPDETVAQQPTPERGGLAVDLAAHEVRGGHTLARHVGRNDEDLRRRLAVEQDLAAASTYPDRATAEWVIAVALANQSERLAAWERKTGNRSNLVLEVDAGRVVGRVLERGAAASRATSSALVVLRWDEGSWYVLTSYPVVAR